MTMSRDEIRNTQAVCMAPNLIFWLDYVFEWEISAWIYMVPDNIRLGLEGCANFTGRSTISRRRGTPDVV